MPPEQPLSILHVAAPGVAGGLESVLLELTGGLRQAGHRVALAAVLDAGVGDHPVPARAEAAGVVVRRLVVPPRAYLREYEMLRQVVAELRPDVVHTHGYRADLIGGLVARRAGIPWVATVHGFTGGGRKNRFYEWLQVRAYRKAQAVVAVSRPIRDRLMGAGVARERVHVLPNTWMQKPVLPRPEARSRLGLDGEEPVIGWVGRLTREKGADLFLDAVAQLPQRHWVASIIGEGSERPALESQARRLGIADRVRWHGLIPNAAGLYSAFDAWVLSSRTEGTPIALFEAMAASVPAVVSAVGGVPDVVSPTEVILVDPERAESIAAGLVSIFDDPRAANERAEAARRRLLDAFAPEGWLDAHVALYRSLGPAILSGT
jgi:glycosyltransferase involved in cell wall biosynthesis